MTVPPTGASEHSGAAGSPPGPGPWALLSVSALRRNAEIAASSGIAPRTDPLAADAWGHGASWVRDVLGSRASAVDGATLYGLPGGDPEAVPVLRLRGRVLSVKRLRAGEGVSYGLTHRAAADTRIALVTGGYAQGVVRSLGNRVGVGVGAALRPIVGRVAMDVCVVDVGGLGVAGGDEVVYFGHPGHGEPSLAAWVEATGLSAIELVAAVGLRVPRRMHA